MFFVSYANEERDPYEEDVRSNAVRAPEVAGSEESRTASALGISAARTEASI